MLLSQQPRKVPLAFAENGEKTTIPEEDSPFAGKASLNVGFPPLTRTALDDGGIPPDGLDMNGILYLMSLINRWQSAGGSFAYDSTFANDTNVAGYPKGAAVLRADGTGFWLNQADANTTNPDTGGANWQPINNVGTAIVTTTGGNVTMTALQYARDVIVVSGALTSNTNIIFPNIVKQWLVFNVTTGAYTVTAKTAAGAGVTINNGSNTPRIIYCDTTDCYGVTALRSTQAQVDTGTDEYTFLTPKTFKDSQELINLQNNIDALLDFFLPIGRIVEFGTTINPNTQWPTTTWVRYSEGKTTIGYKSGDANFGTLGATGGAVEHVMTSGNLIQHSHPRNSDGFSEATNVDTNGTISGNYSPGSNFLRNYTTTGIAGSATPDPIPTLSPYIVSAKWIRTA